MTKIMFAAIAFALAFSLEVKAEPSHCVGLSEDVCGTTTACRWQAGSKWINAEDETKTRELKGHCRLDVKAAMELARKAVQTEAPSQEPSAQ